MSSRVGTPNATFSRMAARMQRVSRRFGISIAAACWGLAWVACSTEPQKITVGYRPSEVGAARTQHDASVAGARMPEAGEDAPAPQAGSGAAGKGDDLGAKIAMGEVTVDVIRLQCDAGCAEVSAIARGGNPPYEFVWDDGTKGAMRKLCPDTPGKRSVKVTDTEVASLEFSYSAQTVSADVTTQVSECRQLCLENPSFEGKPAINVPGTNAFDGGPWINCNLFSPDILNETVLSADAFNVNMERAIKASEGSTYLVMYDNSFAANTPPSAYQFECVSQKLCQPLQAGEQYNFTVDLAFDNGPWFYSGNGQGKLEVWGGTDLGAATEQLWVSPMVGKTWQRYCVTFTPKQDLSYLTLKPSHYELTTTLNDEGIAITATGVFVDNIVPVQSCGR